MTLFEATRGWMTKLGGGRGGFRTWRRRWFFNSVEDELTLWYAAKPDKPHATKGAINLRDMFAIRVVPPHPKKKQKKLQMGFQLTCRDRIFK
jgi:hypothetical protein